MLCTIREWKDNDKKDCKIKKAVKEYECHIANA